jgi:dTDP-4-amino-4,6-dideoxygalactose transaminase
LQPAAKSLDYQAGDFPVTMKAAARILSLPLYPGMTHAQQDYVAEVVRDFYKSNHAR